MAACPVSAAERLKGTRSSFRLQFVVFFLVSASFANIYITQPVLPLLQDEFGVDLVVVSLTVSFVILGMTLSNLPFGVLVLTGYLSDLLS